MYDLRYYFGMTTLFISLLPIIKIFNVVCIKRLEIKCKLLSIYSINNFVQFSENYDRKTNISKKFKRSL